MRAPAAAQSAGWPVRLAQLRRCAWPERQAGLSAEGAGNKKTRFEKSITLKWQTNNEFKNVVE